MGSRNVLLFRECLNYTVNGSRDNLGYIFLGIMGIMTNALKSIAAI